ncbi:hypothetical protein AA309_15595 [Microvirga vignae]|uniref:Uncharacterized protein n=1 Tax=Microvirga vignae TaxID=1225564 RepID=A0A0H1RHX6_9HYPH|nr:hypothetical protein [Microvirga vignae]KLK92237.1 hypothetical protein AA309_15595 [Microvirga vignae]
MFSFLMLRMQFSVSASTQAPGATAGLIGRYVTGINLVRTSASIPCQISQAEVDANVLQDTYDTERIKQAPQ